MTLLGQLPVATYAIENPQKVDRLVLYAPQWLRTTPLPIPASGKLGAYQDRILKPLA